MILLCVAFSASAHPATEYVDEVFFNEIKRCISVPQEVEAEIAATWGQNEWVPTVYV